MSTSKKIFDKLLAGKTITLGLKSLLELENLLGSLRSIKSHQSKSMESLGYSLTNDVIRHSVAQVSSSELTVTLWLGSAVNQRREFKIISETDTRASNYE